MHELIDFMGFRQFAASEIFVDNSRQFSPSSVKDI